MTTQTQSVTVSSDWKYFDLKDKEGQEYKPGIKKDLPSFP